MHTIGISKANIHPANRHEATTTRVRPYTERTLGCLCYGLLVVDHPIDTPMAFPCHHFSCSTLPFNPFSNSSIVGIEDLKSFGKSLDSWYSDMPIGSLYESKAYFATTLSLSLQISKPIVGLSMSVLNWWLMAET